VQSRFIVVAASLTCATGSAAAPEANLSQRLDRMACGNTVIIAHASCYAATPVCVRETLTFHRPESRTILAPHKHQGPHQLQDGRIVEALDYHVSKWACVAGVNGGRYIVFIMARTRDGNCKECEYVRLYHPNGRLIATTLTFDAAGRPREDPRALELVGSTVDRPLPAAFQPVYAR
jgi:hypothetical protein